MQAGTRFRAGIIGFALTFFLLLRLLEQFPSFVERYYSNALYPVITVLVSNFSGQFNFSVTEFVLWFTVFVGLPLVIGRIRRKRHKLGRVLLNLVTVFAVLFIWFYLFWGLNYFREPLKVKLGLDRVDLPMNAFDSTFAVIIQQTNDLNFAYSILDVADINAHIDSAYDEVFENLGLPKVPGYKGLKTFAANWLLNKTTTSGWFSPLFHEVQYNTDLLIYELPFVLAHEKAHQKGYTSEAEANFLAYLVCTSSSEALCRYSGYFHAASLFLTRLEDQEERRQFYLDQLDRGVRFNLREVRARWARHRGWLSRLAKRGYDLYLKSNNVAGGIDSYTRAVDYIILFDKAKQARLSARNRLP